MALPKLFQRIFWHNNTTPAIQEDNLNAMSKGLSDVDDRVIGLAGTIMEDVPQIQEDIEELEADMALIDTKIASATAEANRATTAANNAAASVISAGNKALVSEGWAKGTQNGAAVGSTSPYYHNNAEYFKNQARSFTPQGYQDLVDDVDSLKETLTNFEESITGDVVDSEPYVLRQGLGNLADMALVGGSVAWNQLLNMRDFTNTSGGSVVSKGTASTGSVNITSDGNNTETDAVRLYSSASTFEKSTFAGHKVLIDIGGTNPNTNKISQKFYVSTNTGWESTENILNDSSFAPIIVSMPSDKPYFYWYLNIKASTTCNFTLKPQIFDLTQKFGPTIADYIYSLEQATAGAGVAWFRKYFSNLYYGYQPGKIESVNVGSRKVVGKNIVIGIEGGTWSNSTQTKASSNDRARVDSVLDVFPSTQYTISAKGLDNKTIQVITVFYNNKGSGTFISESSWNTVPYTFTTPNNCKCLTVIFKTSNNDNAPQNYIAEPQIEIGSTATTYEPYKEYSFPFDSSKQLRGIFYLDANNKLCADGDIYKADGSITRKYGIVNLGSVNWSGQASAYFHAYLASSKTNTLKLMCPKFITSSENDVVNHVSENIIAISSGNNILVYAPSYTDAAAFKTAMSGVYLVYELATPTTESANAYQNPQRAFIDGTEEFVDYGVQSATRDVSIPVGNNTTYQLNETLPPTEDYVDGALKFKAAISALGTDESRRTTASRAYTAGEFFYKDGKMYKVLTSIAQGATFTINTNCQQTTLFAELKALAQ